MSLETLRKKINTIDEDIIRLLAERQKVVKAIGQLKMEMGTTIIDPEREHALIEFHQRLGATYALSPDFIDQLFSIIILESRKLQQ